MASPWHRWPIGLVSGADFARPVRYRAGSIEANRCGFELPTTVLL